MPTYDYLCGDCSHKFEHFQSITSEPLKECPRCSGKLRRLIGGGGAVIFKGDGFFCTDYRKHKTREDKNQSKEEVDSGEGNESLD